MCFIKPLLAFDMPHPHPVAKVTVFIYLRKRLWRQEEDGAHVSDLMGNAQE